MHQFMIGEILADIKHALGQLQPANDASLVNFKQQKQQAARLMLNGALQRLLRATEHTTLSTHAQQLSRAQPEKMGPLLNELAELAVDLPAPKKMSVPRLPSDIRDVVSADLMEITACIGAGCYRSAVILCGRVLETALHRKYYDATGNDLLEKAPGIGLGSLIAKLSEKGIALDPGLSNQIHLINQVRIFSVHTKKEVFTPTKNQTEAIVLYTTDVIEKLFAK